MEACLLREDKNGVSYLTLNRPEKLNSVDTVLFEAMEKELDEIGKNPEIHVIVLKGSGRAFCAGHDVSGIGNGKQDGYLDSRVVAKLADMPQAVVAIIHGHCYTGGLELALAADIIIAGEGAKIGDTHSKFALCPVWGLTQRLPRRIGVNRAKDMVFTNRVYTGAQAAQIGLADYCFADDELWERADEIVQKINQNSPFTIRYFKQMLRDTDGNNLSVGLESERRAVGVFGPDYKARISAIKRKK